MKTLYLHIGTTKTATTSIQRFLEENKDVLQKYGYCFPDSLHVYPRANKGEMHTFWLQKCGMQTVAETNRRKRNILKRGYSRSEPHLGHTIM